MQLVLGGPPGCGADARDGVLGEFSTSAGNSGEAGEVGGMRAPPPCMPQFDRIHLGHAPDRVGLLPALLGCLPLLKQAPHAMLTHSVACGTAAEDDYEAYVQVRPEVSRREFHTSGSVRGVRALALAAGGTTNAAAMRLCCDLIWAFNLQF